MVLECPVSRDMDVELTMVLPTEMSDQAGVFVRAIGKVVRVEEWSNNGTRRAGVATVIRRYEIVRSESIQRPTALSRSL
jgi:hypothetical protein